MKPFMNRILICLIPVLIGLYVVGAAIFKYQRGEGGFKLGVDLVGGTILVYEVDVDKFPDGKLPDNYKPEDLAGSLKRRIDPSDLYNVTIRPVSNTRVEIILPTGGAHQARAEQEKWTDLLKKAEEQWPQQLTGKHLDAPRGDTVTLIGKLKGFGISAEDAQSFVGGNYRATGKKQDFTSEKIQEVKDKIAQVGSLEFRILANNEDDRDAIEAARKYIDEQNEPTEEGKERKKHLLDLAEKDKAPPVPAGPEEGLYDTRLGRFKYTWVELGKSERKSLGLDNESANNDPRWQRAAEARKRGQALLLSDYGQTLLYSRECVNLRLPPEERTNKKVEYFLLVRDPEPSKEVTGQYLVRAEPGTDNRSLKPAVHFTFNTAGGNLFYDLTQNNKPSEAGGAQFHRHLAIILDNKIVSAPTLNEPIRSQGQISGNFTQKEVERLVSVLRAGALPATLKGLPVSESTVGSTLGDDTIRAGAFSVVLAFIAVLAFMGIYYRFAGMVACIALLANLLLTIAFMVLVNATFTLPGIAGLVLTIGMAVDANVLIYERLREERDRGASLALAIRNGYDRSFGTIIDTHLSSIVTAIILYVVGNDQLKGFAISLTVGLIISLFTSLYMTRLIFDICLAKGWLTELRMFRLFARPNIDFMRVRNYWFTATISLTVIGVAIFLIRGQEGLNIDFVGGTAYGGQLREPLDLKTLRDLLDRESQQERLKIAKVEELDSGSDSPGKSFRISYSDGKSYTVRLPNAAPGATPEERSADVAERARSLPDWSVQQSFRATLSDKAGESPSFTIRTTEKAPDLVQVTVDRLLRGADGQPLQKNINLIDYKIEGKKAVLTFDSPALPGYLKTMLEREFQNQGIATLQPVDVVGRERDAQGNKLSDDEGRSTVIETSISDATLAALTPAKYREIIERTKSEFAARPQPERLENFDSGLAAETQRSALYAVLISWAALLFYIWFRFGNWTFGLAAILCLLHDVLFTLGILAFCHYIYEWTPWLASALMIQDFKLDLPTVAALLTLVGYSINDKIVVYDRMREVRGKKPELTAEIINDSINQALSRTVLTGLSVMLVLLVLYIFGGDGIHQFAFVMLIGLIIGTYSSIYIASPLLLIFGEGRQASGARKKEPEPEPEPEGATT